MSLRIDKKCITIKMATDMRKDLFLKPKVSYSGSEPDPILCQVVTSDSVFLPLRYGRDFCLQNEIQNPLSPYPTRKFNFKAG